MFNTLVYKKGDETVTQLFFGQDSCERAGKIVTSFGQENSVLSVDAQPLPYLCYSHGGWYEVGSSMISVMLVIFVLSLLSDVLVALYRRIRGIKKDEKSVADYKNIITSHSQMLIDMELKQRNFRSDIYQMLEKAWIKKNL